MAWLNWPQIHSGRQARGSPRISRGADQIGRRLAASSAARPAALSSTRPTRTRPDGPAVRRRASRIRMASSGLVAIVAPPPHGARMTNARTSPSSARTLVVPGAAKRRIACARSSPVAVASRPIIASRSPGLEGSDRRVRRLRARSLEARRFEDAVPRLEGEAHALVERQALRRWRRGGGSGSRRLARPSIDRLGQGPPEARSAVPRRIDPDRADPADGAVRGADAGADEPPPSIRPRPGGTLAASGELEPRVAGRPSRRAGCSASRRRRRRRSWGGCAREPAPSRWYAAPRMPSAIIGRWPPCHARTSSTLPTSPASGMSAEELDRLEGQLNHILDQYAKLAELDTDAIAPTAQTIELENILREDVVTPSLPARRSSPTPRSGRATSSSSRRSSAAMPAEAAADGRPRPMSADPPPPRPRDGGPPALRRGLIARPDRGPPRRRRAPRTTPSTPGSSIDREGALPRPMPRTHRLASARRDGPAALDRLHPLLGIPVALKDLVSVEGGQCTAGSRILAGYRAPYDAHIIERLRGLGAVILGKTNMDEFAMGSSNEYSAYGPVSNPWDLDTRARREQRRIGRRGRRLPRAAASARTPAAPSASRRRCAGSSGMKPTYGRVSRYGIVAFASSLDQIGPFARDARDAAALLHAVAGRDDRDSTSAPVPVPDDADCISRQRRRGRRLAARQALRAAARVLRRRHGPGRRAPRPREPWPPSRRAGAKVEEVSLPHTDYGLATYYIVAPAEASANLARYDGVRYGHSRRLEGATSSPTTWPRGARASGPRSSAGSCSGRTPCRPATTTPSTSRPRRSGRSSRRDFDEVFASGIDALVAPTSPSVAFRFGARMADPSPCTSPMPAPCR